MPRHLNSPYGAIRAADRGKSKTSGGSRSELLGAVAARHQYGQAVANLPFSDIAGKIYSQAAEVLVWKTALASWSAGSGPSSIRGYLQLKDR
jgi:hypothetical protein